MKFNLNELYVIVSFENRKYSMLTDCVFSGEQEALSHINAMNCVYSLQALPLSEYLEELKIQSWIEGQRDE